MNRENLKILISILILLVIGIIGVIIVLNLQLQKNASNLKYTNNDNIIYQANEYINKDEARYESVLNNNYYLNDESEQEVNNFENEEINKADLMQEYLDDYSFNILNNTGKAYNMLDSEYRSKRFKTFEEFVKFLIEKEEQLSNINLLQYKAYEEDEYNVYEGTDENGNYYKIKEYGYMNYTMMLDNYTMQEDYSDSSDEEKIKKSVETFILMINSANYSGAYILLEPTFKATYFPTEEEFINYIKTNWFKRNIIAKKEITETGTCIVSMREKIATTSNKMQKEFVVILGEGTEFTIQFNI